MVAKLKRFWFYLRLYPHLMSRSLQARMTYKADFIIGVLGSLFMQSLGFIFLWTVFRNVPEVNGWTFYEMIFVYGMAAMALGLNEFLFPGTWSIGSLVSEGGLDRLLLRPQSTIFSIMSFDVTLHGLGSVMFGFAASTISLVELKAALSLYIILFWIVSIICGALIFFSMNMLMATLAFWIVESQSAMMLVQNVSDFSKYPISIYGSKLQILLTYIIPFGFSSYYPAAFILNKNEGLIYLLGPVLATALCLLLTRSFWNFALKRYQSAGG